MPNESPHPSTPLPSTELREAEQSRSLGVTLSLTKGHPAVFVGHPLPRGEGLGVRGQFHGFLVPHRGVGTGIPAHEPKLQRLRLRRSPKLTVARGVACFGWQAVGQVRTNPGNPQISVSCKNNYRLRIRGNPRGPALIVAFALRPKASGRRVGRDAGAVSQPALSRSSAPKNGQRPSHEQTRNVLYFQWQMPSGTLP
jgi:hypothetical protein